MKIKDCIQRHLQVLCNEIGARPTGSQANKAATAYASKEFESCGLTVHRQQFDCMDWKNNGATLTVQGQRIPVAPSPYALACHVQGEIVRVGSLEQLREIEITGKIAVLHGALVSEPLMPKSFVFWNPDEHKEIIALLENGRPLAVLTLSLSAEQFVPVIEDGDFLIPCGVVMPESFHLLHDGISVNLCLDTDRQPAKCENVIAAYGRAGAKICFSAHIDTKPGTPGASDNAAGVAVLLALAREIAEREFPCRIEFVLFNGEDYYSTPGETAYLSSYLSVPGDYICAFNIDGAGIKGYDTAYSFYECPEARINTIRDLAAKLSGFTETEPWPQGDHTLFSISGIPAVSVTSNAIFETVDNVVHSELDTIDGIDLQKLDAAVQFLLGSI